MLRAMYAGSVLEGLHIIFIKRSTTLKCIYRSLNCGETYNELHVYGIMTLPDSCTYTNTGHIRDLQRSLPL